MKIDRRKLRSWSLVGSTGTYGMAMEELAEEVSGLSKPPRLLRIGVEDRYPHAGPYHSLMTDAGLTWNQILQKINSALS